MEAQVENQFQYLSQPEDIARELQHSMEHGNVIGICALSLGPNMVMTAVEEILEIKNDLLIQLKETDLLGMKLADGQILLSEIVRVHPFRTHFNDPFHVQLREMKRGENGQ
jgi:hypothetical protein